MTDIFTLGGELRSADAYFEKNKSIGAEFTTEALKVGFHNGSLTVEVNASSQVEIANGGSIAFALLESDTKDGAFTKPTGNPTLTIAGETSFAEGDKMATLVLPNTKKYVKIKVTPTGSPTGSVDIWQSYLAR